MKSLKNDASGRSILQELFGKRHTHEEKGKPRDELKVKDVEIASSHSLSYSDKVSYDPDTTGASPYSRIFIYRDYSEGTYKFSDQIPPVLANEMHVGEATWKKTMDEINRICGEAERSGLKVFWENMIYCFSLYTLTSYRMSHYAKCMRRLSKYISEQNQKVYDALGLRIRDPSINGYRYLEVLVKYLEWRWTMPILHWGKDYPTNPKLEPWELDQDW